MTKPLAALPLVCVVWEDAACTVTGDYTQEAALREFKAPDIYKTFGLLLTEDADKVLIASDECVSDPGFRGINRIPKGMVREIIRLPTPRRAKRPRRPAPAAPALSSPPPA